MNPNYWLIRAEGGEIIDLFIDNNIVAIGWEELGDLCKYKTREDLYSAIQKIYSHRKIGHHRNVTGMLFRFTSEIQLKDKVITYDPSKRIYHLGEIQSDYYYDTQVSNRWPNIRKVSWEKELSRDFLSLSTKNSLGSTLTLFKVDEKTIQELNSIQQGKKIKITHPEEVVEDNIFKDIQTKSFEYIKDKLMKLDWEEMQSLIAGLLRAMGYKTKISPLGSDLGKDIIASPDGFGLEQPRIVVEVKHRTQAIGSQGIRSFLGGRHKDDKGLYVSTGGFSKDAKYEADRASIPITLLGIDDLVTEVLNHYESLDVETKLLLPLTKIYWPK